MPRRLLRGWAAFASVNLKAPVPDAADSDVRWFAGEIAPACIAVIDAVGVPAIPPASGTAVCPPLEPVLALPLLLLLLLLPLVPMADEDDASGTAGVAVAAGGLSPRIARAAMYSKTAATLRSSLTHTRYRRKPRVRAASSASSGVTAARSNRSTLFCTSTVGIAPHSSSTFLFHDDSASKDARSVVEKTSMQHAAPAAGGTKSSQL